MWKVKSIITRFYNYAVMKKKYLGMLMILPEVMDEVNEEIESMREKIISVFKDRE